MHLPRYLAIRSVGCSRGGQRTEIQRHKGQGQVHPTDKGLGKLKSFRRGVSCLSPVGITLGDYFTVLAGLERAKHQPLRLKG